MSVVKQDEVVGYNVNGIGLLCLECGKDIEIKNRKDVLTDQDLGEAMLFCDECGDRIEWK